MRRHGGGKMRVVGSSAMGEKRAALVEWERQIQSVREIVETPASVVALSNPN